MKIDYLSASSCDSFLDCPYKFIKDKEARKKKTNVVSSHALSFGSFVHLVLELFFKIKSSHYTVEDILGIKDRFVKTDTEEVKANPIVKLTKKDLTNMKVLLQKDWENKLNSIPILNELTDSHLFNFNFPGKKKPVSVLKEVKEIFKNMVEDENRNWFSISPDDIFAVEYEFDVVTNQGVPLYGFIDLITKDKLNYNFVDWKSGKYFYSFDDVNDLLQFDHYSLAVSQQEKFKDKNHIFCLDSCQNNGYIDVEKDKKNINSVDNFFGSLWDAMLNFDEKNPIPSMCRWCAYCPYTNGCQALKDAFDMNVDTPLSLNKLTMKELVGTSTSFKQKASVFYAIQKKYDEEVKARLTQGKLIGKQIIEDDFKIKLSQINKTKILVTEVSKYMDLQVAIDKGVLTVSNKALEKALPKEDYIAIKNNSPKSSSYRLDIKKVKIKK